MENMERNSGRTKSIWMEEPEYLQQSELKESLECDVCVVGGGITGLTAAYLLSQENLKVVLVTAGVSQAGETLRTTAHLTYIPDYRYQEIARMHGIKAATLVMQSHADAIKFIESTIAEHKIKCQFKRLDAYLFAAPGTSFNELKQEAKICRKIGISNVHELKALKILKHAPPALQFSDQAQFDIVKYLQGLYEISKRNKVTFYTNTQVIAVEKGAKEINVRTDSGKTISAKSVVVATGSPFTDPLTLPLKQFAYRTYAIAGLLKSNLPEALYWDTGEPYHYVRFHQNEKGDKYIIVGGEDHRTGQNTGDKDQFARLEKWAAEYFPAVDKITHQWSGQVLEPADALPFIGKNPLSDSGIYIATGMSGNGTTYGTTAALLITDSIIKRRNSYSHLFSPERLALKGLNNLISNNLCSVLQYANNLKANSENKFCTHMHAVLIENGCEDSLDCPAHGSRFNKSGEVIYGPACKDL